ncbi:MAG: zf-HC2 domain-containing protein, partial [Pirellulaceae bacterium]
MTDSPIQPGDFSEELLSGYLDGELSSEEQALVESALDRDPQVQQLLDDLQQLRQCLQELPQEQPPENARQRVIEQVRSSPRVQEAPSSDSVEGKNIARGSSSTRSMVPWLAAAAAAVALLFAVPPMLQDSSQVAQKSDAPNSLSAPMESAANEALSFKAEDGEALGMAADAIAGDTEEYFADAQIPVVYVTLPADAIDEIPTILAANSIREVDPSVLVQRMRANKLADDPLRRWLAENDDLGTVGSLARSIHSQTELPAENSSVDI